MKAGPRNHILDVAGLAIGHAVDTTMKSGVTAVVPSERAVCSVAVGGGSPGTRETDLLSPERTVERIDAVILAGGSAFGLAAADGAMAELARHGRGLAVRGYHVPIVPAGIVFDLAAGGTSDHDRGARYRDLGRAAVRAVAEPAATPNGADVRLGTVGVGVGCRTAGLKGGFGSASTRLESGVTVGAAVAVNAVGSVVFGGGPHFRAAPFELDGEFGGLGLPPTTEGADALTMKAPGVPGGNTVVAVIATDAVLSKAEAKQLATIAHDGIAVAVWPAHTPMDGDTVFAIATGQAGDIDPLDYAELCAAAVSTLARAIARGVYEAEPHPSDPEQTWRARFTDTADPSREG